MARGKVAAEGTERVADNGYVYRKVQGRGWVLKHWLVAEKSLGRLIDSATDVVKFNDGNRTNFDPNNIVVVPKGTSHPRRRIAQIEARIAELEAEKALLLKQLKAKESR